MELGELSAAAASVYVERMRRQMEREIEEMRELCSGQEDNRDNSDKWDAFACLDVLLPSEEDFVRELRNHKVLVETDQFPNVLWDNVCVEQVICDFHFKS